MGVSLLRQLLDAMHAAGALEAFAAREALPGPASSERAASHVLRAAARCLATKGSAAAEEACVTAYQAVDKLEAIAAEQAAERHGSAAERLLAANNPNRSQAARPNQFFAASGGSGGSERERRERNKPEPNS